MVEDLIDVDQTGFMPGKGTDINIRHLFLNLLIPHDNTGVGIVTSINVEKAF